MKKLLAAQSRPQDAVNPNAWVSPPLSSGLNIEAVLFSEQSRERSTTEGATGVAAGRNDVREGDVLVDDSG